CNFSRPAYKLGYTEGAFPVCIFLTAERSCSSIRPCIAVRPVICAVHYKSILSNSQLIKQVKHLPNVFIMVNHCIMIWRLPPACLPEAFLFCMSESMHVGSVKPNQERFAVFVRLLDKVSCVGYKFIIAGFHAFFCKRACVFYFLFANSSPAFLFSRVILIGCPAVQHSAGTEHFSEFRKIFFVRVVIHFRLFLGI